jgi:hypothetical protein
MWLIDKGRKYLILRFSAGKYKNIPFVMHYKIRNGLVSEAWTIPEDLYMYDEYWSGPSQGTKDLRAKVLVEVTILSENTMW